MDEKEKKEECIKNINKYIDEINFIRQTSVDENNLSMETLFRLAYSIGKAWLIYNTIYKVKNAMLIEKHRKIHEDSGLSSVIGTLLMVTITVSLFTTVFFISSQMNTTMLETSKATAQSIIDMSNANMDMIRNFVDNVNNISFDFNLSSGTGIYIPPNHPDPNTYPPNIPPPLINYTYNTSTSTWIITICSEITHRYNYLVFNELGELTLLPPNP